MRSEFELDPHLIYLNSGTHSICPKSVLEAVTRYQREYERNPTLQLFDVYRKLWDTQKDLAEFFHARPEDVFLRSNVSLVMNIFIHGMDFGDGEILVSDLEYGGVTEICRARAKKRKLAFRELHLPTATGDVAKLRDAVVSQLGPETKMLMLSHVTTGTGLVLPIREIARETRRRGILFAVDGAHGPGSVPLDFRELEDLDFYGGNLHKWMMAPKGTAMGWVHPRHHDALDPLFDGWTSTQTPDAFAEFGGGARFPARMLMPGGYDYAPFLAIRDTLAFWRKHGEKKIHDRIYALQADLEKKLDAELKPERVSPPAGPSRGPLLTYRMPPHLERTGQKLLLDLAREQGLQISVTMVQGKWCMRFSPHVYNTEDDATRAVEILKKIWIA